jgi:hypothetical protein
VSIVLPEMPPEVAMMNAEPVPIPVARPPGATVAIKVAPEDQVTEEVTSRDVPSEYVPVAVNCFVELLAMIGLTGVTETD